jgi:hypothetical protein
MEMFNIFTQYTDSWMNVSRHSLIQIVFDKISFSKYANASQMYYLRANKLCKQINILLF